jgi:chromosome segregation ATPase
MSFRRSSSVPVGAVSGGVRSSGGEGVVRAQDVVMAFEAEASMDKAHVKNAERHALARYNELAAAVRAEHVARDEMQRVEDELCQLSCDMEETCAELKMVCSQAKAERAKCRLNCFTTTPAMDQLEASRRRLFESLTQLQRRFAEAQPARGQSTEQLRVAQRVTQEAFEALQRAKERLAAVEQVVAARSATSFVRA